MTINGRLKALRIGSLLVVVVVVVLLIGIHGIFYGSDNVLLPAVLCVLISSFGLGMVFGLTRRGDAS